MRLRLNHCLSRDVGHIVIALRCVAAVFLCDAASADRATLGYVLQADQLASTRADVVDALASCGRDWIVLDASYDGSASGRWSVSELATIREGRVGRRIIAYVSIGEAETYRSYWDASWDADHDGRPDAKAPDFLLGENPDWEGNYRVRYWSQDWQSLMLEEIEKVVDQGFDGVYLDIVDAFEQFEFDGTDWIDDRENDATGRTYREDMIAWVTRIASFARERGDGDFAVVPQNGPQLLADANYRQVISAVGIEDLFTDGRRKQSRSDSTYRLGFLKRAVAAGIPVFVIEYATKKSLRELATREAARHGLSLLLTDRELATLGVSVAPE